MRTNIVGTHLRLRVIWCSLDQPEVVLRVETLHDDDGAARPCGSPMQNRSGAAW